MAFFFYGKYILFQLATITPEDDFKMYSKDEIEDVIKEIK